MIGPLTCPACEEQVVEATVGPRTVLLDYMLAPKGAVAARINPDTDQWEARFLAFGEEHDPATEVRFRQHDVTCRPVKKKDTPCQP